MTSKSAAPPVPDAPAPTPSAAADSLNRPEFEPLAKVKKARRVVFLLVPLLVLVSAAVAGAFTYWCYVRPASLTHAMTPRTTPTTQAAVPKKRTPFLLFADYTNGVMTLKDTSNNPVYSVSYPKREIIGFTDVSPAGELLLNLETNTAAKYNFLLVDKSGKSVPIDPSALAVLAASLPSPQAALFTDDATVITTNCTYDASASLNDCKLIKLNLLNGYATTLLETSAPWSPGGSTGFYVMGLSADKTLAYLYAMGPTKLGSATGLYAYTLASGASRYLINVPGDQAALSPDSQKIASIVSSGSDTNTMATLHVQTISTGKDVTTTLDNTPTDPALVWSPDSDKLLYHTAKANDVISVFDPTANFVEQIQSVPNDGFHAYDSLFWVDESHIVYGLETASSPYNFSSGQTLEEDLATQKVTPLTPPPSTSYVLQVAAY